MASTSNAYDFDLFDSRDHGSAVPKLPEPKAPQKQKQKNNVVKLDEKQLRRSHRHSANTVKMLMNLAVVLVIVGAIGAVVFSTIGYFYIKQRGKGKLAKAFIPTITEEERAAELPEGTEALPEGTEESE